MDSRRLIPPEVFTAYAKKRDAARIDALRKRLQLQTNMGDTGSRPGGSEPQARAAIIKVNRPR